MSFNTSPAYSKPDVSSFLIFTSDSSNPDNYIYENVEGVHVLNINGYGIPTIYLKYP